MARSLSVFIFVIAPLGFIVGWFVAGQVPTESAPQPSHESHALDPSRPDKATRSARIEMPKRSTAISMVPAQFVDVAKQMGIDFQLYRGVTGDFWLPESMGGGIGWIDLDGDQLHDLYFAQGCDLLEPGKYREGNQLFRQGPDGSWLQIPPWAGVADLAYSNGVTVGDFNNDGFEDLYVTNYGSSTGFLNNGDGTFAEMKTSKIDDRWGTSAACGDLDRDGDLDLYVANYVVFDPTQRCSNPKTQVRNYCGPEYYEAQQDILLMNSGDSWFQDVAQEVGVQRAEGKGLGVIIADLLGDDLHPEVFVANDLRPNFLFQNLAKEGLHFEEVGFRKGVAVNGEGICEANMGIACGDYDEDGLLDIYVTHYYMEHDTLWRGIGENGFADQTKSAGLSLPTLPQLSWGTNFLDYDNDGWLDLFVTSGHFNDSGGGTIPYAMRPQLFFNAGRSGQPVRFVDASFASGDYFQNQYVGRSSCVADFDLDGDTDIAVGHQHAPFALLRNDSPDSGNSIGIRLIGTRSNRSGIGAKIVVELLQPDGTPRSLFRESIGGGSYISSDSRDLLFGIGAVERVSRISIRWPSGTTSEFRDVQSGSYYLAVEGSEKLEQTAFLEHNEP